MKYTEVKKIINTYDPIGLISLGAPKDEYDTEIKGIVGCLDYKMRVEEIAVVVRKIFVDNFGEEVVGPYDFTQIARESFACIT